jgi:uncharacterized protein (TIGR02246 family)
VSLTTARGPLGPDPAGRFSSPLPPRLVYVEPHPRRIQAVLDGKVVIDTEQALIVHRPGRTLTYAFPREVVAGLPSTPEPEASGYVTVPWDAVDTWIEEGRELVLYPPNPYHRVDCRPTTRRLRVEIAGATLVDTDDTTIVFETGHAPRLYVDPALVRTDLLRPTATTSYCNYKGWATWWAAVVDGVVFEDVAWSYDDPPPESLPIRGHLSFDEARAEVTSDLPRTSPLAGRRGDLMEGDQVNDIEAIKQLKARYCRTMDTKDWAGMRRVFADDVTMDTTDSGGGVITGADDFLAFLREAIGGAVTVHQCHTPEIELTSPTTASGIWAMEDMLRFPDGTELHGYGHYHETYEKRTGRWQIASSTLTRLRMDMTPGDTA